MEDTGNESDDGQQAALIHLDGQGTRLSAGDTGFKLQRVGFWSRCTWVGHDW